MRAVIICGGRVTDPLYIKRQIRVDDTIICADSGYDHAVNMGLNVRVVVGDFDSMTAVCAAEKIQYPTRKDNTDSEIAIQHARDLGFRDFLLIASTGTRLDHTLNNIFILKDCLDRGENAVIIDEHNKIMITNSTLRLYEPPGSIVSIIPLVDSGGVTTQNLEYPLDNATLYVGKGRGISNVMCTDTAVVSVNNGILLVIVASD